MLRSVSVFQYHLAVTTPCLDLCLDIFIYLKLDRNQLHSLLLISPNRQISPPWRTDTPFPSPPSLRGKIYSLYPAYRRTLIHIQWKIGPNRYHPYCLDTATTFTDSSLEYALNAVNQGVTSLGIKGTFN